MKKLSLILVSLSLLISLDGWSAVSGWSQKASLAAHGRHRGVGIAIGTKGYMGLGHYNGAGPNIVLKDWWQYDPASNTWTQKADYIGNGGNGTYAPLTFGMDDYGFIGGGQVAFSLSFYKYDPATNLWSAVADCPVHSQNFKAFAFGTKGYCIEGNQVYEYDAITDIWSVKTSIPFTVGVWNSSFVIDGKGYIKNGTSLWEYKPTTDQWTNRASYPGIATRASASFSQNNKGYIVCGYSGSLSNVQGETWEFDPALNQWNQLLDFPGTKRRFCSGFTIGNRAFMGIGTNGTNFSDLWEFDATQVYADLDEQTNKSNFHAFPNPAVNLIKFKSDQLKEFEIHIFSLTGKLIGEVSATNGFVTFNRGNISSGAYLYQVVFDGEIIHQERILFN